MDFFNVLKYFKNLLYKKFNLRTKIKFYIRKKNMLFKNNYLSNRVFLQYYMQVGLGVKQACI